MSVLGFFLFFLFFKIPDLVVLQEVIECVQEWEGALVVVRSWRVSCTGGQSSGLTARFSVPPQLTVVRTNRLVFESLRTLQ